MGVVSTQIIVTVLIAVLVFINSFATVWPSYALKILEGEDSPLGYPITKIEGNLIASVVMLGAVVSIPIAGYINDTIGRKRSVILTGLCLLLGWSIITTAKTVTQLVIGRLSLGLGSGIQIVTVFIFVSEISQETIRGPLLTLACSLYNIGALASYIAGWFCSYEVINYINLSIIAGFVIIVASCLKETPSYLLKIGKDKEALSSLKFYRGTTTVTKEILEELAYTRRQTCDYNDNTGKYDNEKEKLHVEKNVLEDQQKATDSCWKILLSSKSSQRAILLLSVQMILAVCVGMIGIQAYAGPMFRRAVPSLSPDLCSVILAIVMSIVNIVAVFVTNIVPRRVLMISTCILATVCLAVLSSILHWGWAPEWTIPLVVFVYCVAFQLGVVNVPFVQVAECVTPKLQSFTATTIMFCMFIANFIVLMLFEPMVNVFGLDGVFFLFAIMGAVSVVMAYFFMRETRKVSFEVIQETFEEGFLYHKNK